MAQRLWRHTHRHAVPTSDDTFNGNYSDAEFLAQDHFGRDDDHNTVRPVASASSQLEQPGTNNAGNLLEPEQNHRLHVENFQPVGV